MRCSVLLVLAACAGPPPEAPAELGQLGLFLFQHFEDDDTAELEAGFRNLAGFLRGEDYSLDPRDRDVSMPDLDGLALGELRIPEGADAAEQVSVAISARSEHALDAQVALMTDPVQTCIESSATTWAGRDFQSDVACFESGDCDRLDTLTEVRRDQLFVKFWYDQFKAYRSFEVEEEGGEVFRVIAGRAHNDRLFVGDNGTNELEQLFHLDVYLEDGARTLRWFSMWSSISVVGVSDGIYRTAVVNGLEEAMEYGEEYLSGVQESCPHDRDAPRPERET
ncbi:MAG: hypothetical protein KTR31_34625 [Myxococcales bacterium]|nr:hypothetical protein [Myxococcales bacterium]